MLGFPQNGFPILGAGAACDVPNAGAFGPNKPAPGGGAGDVVVVAFENTEVPVPFEVLGVNWNVDFDRAASVVFGSSSGFFSDALGAPNRLAGCKEL